MKGNFVVKKLKHAFSAIVIDHAHEQNNAKVKWDVGAVGLTENPAALYHWMVSGSEMTRIIEEFEDSIEKKQNAYCSYQEQRSMMFKWHLQKMYKHWLVSLKNLEILFVKANVIFLYLRAETMQTPCRHSNCRRAWCVRLRNLDLSSMRLTLKRDWSAKQRLSLIHWNTTICPYLVDLQSEKSQASNYRCQH